MPMHQETSVQLLSVVFAGASWTPIYAEMKGLVNSADLLTPSESLCLDSEFFGAKILFSKHLTRDAMGTLWSQFLTVRVGQGL